MFKKDSLIILFFIVALFLQACGINKLSPEKQEVIERFLLEATRTPNVYETSTTQQQNPEIKNLAEEVVKIGRPAVPYIISSIGYGKRDIYNEKQYGYHPHYWQIVVLTRIEGRSSINGLIKILKYKYTEPPPGTIAWSPYFENDRIMAAQALVALGVKESIPHLEKVIEEMKKEVNTPEAEERLQSMTEPFRSQELADHKRKIALLERELSKLKRGEGIRDASNFPYLPRLQAARTGKEKEISQLMGKIENLKSWQPTIRRHENSSV